MTGSVWQVLGGATFSSLMAFSAASAKPIKLKPLQSQPPRVLLAMSSPLKSGHPLDVIEVSQKVENESGFTSTRIPTPIQFVDNQLFAKWSVIFEAPVALDQVRVTACSAEGELASFKDGVELFWGESPERQMSQKKFAEGGQESASFLFSTKKRKVMVQALSFNFLGSQKLCIKSVEFLLNGKLADISVPRVLDISSASAAAMGLGDGRIGKVAAFASTEKNKIDDYGEKIIRLTWKQPLAIEKLRVWNGNQVLGDMFFSSSRARTLLVTALNEAGKELSEAQKYILSDRRGFQDLELSGVSAAYGLKLEVADRYAPTMPSKFRNPAAFSLSQIQILSGKTVWVVGALKREPANLKKVVPVGFSSEIYDREIESVNEQNHWRFRFRSDGTVAAHTFTEKARVPKEWTLIGVWQKTSLRDPSWTSINKDNKEDTDGIFIQLSGVRYAMSGFFDAAFCGNQCVLSADARGPAGTQELPVNEVIEIQPVRELKHHYILRNRTAKESRTIDFSDLRVRLSTISD